MARILARVKRVTRNAPDQDAGNESRVVHLRTVRGARRGLFIYRRSPRTRSWRRQGGKGPPRVLHVNEVSDLIDEKNEGSDLADEKKPSLKVFTNLC
jgi:hypothetical protein